MWHCPHCGAPQAETARCWVCHRSSTTCSTCRHFRASLAADLGYCALDRKRRPLTGLELRGCWSERASTGADQGRPRTAEGHLPAPTEAVPIRGFVPLDLIEPHAPPGPDPTPAAPAITWDARTSLFGDAER